MKDTSPNTFRNRIVDHFEELHLDVVCRKKRSGYSLYWDDDSEPWARLCPTGKADEVEVYSWEDGHWRKVDEVPPALPLNEALDYISEDLGPEFFQNEGKRPIPITRSGREMVSAVVQDCCGRIVLYSMVAGAVGGVFVSPLAGALWGAVVATFFSAGIRQLFTWRIKQALLGIATVGIPAAIAAAAGGALAAGLHAALGGGVGWLLCAIMAGAFCSLLVLSVPRLAWLLGLFAGVVAGMQLVDLFGLRSETLRYGVVAIMAAGTAKACLTNCKYLMDWYNAVDIKANHKYKPKR